MNISRLFILRPVATTLTMLALLLAGAIGYFLLPVAALPQVDYPMIRVVTLYPGASPSVMSSAVTSPLERQFGKIAGLSQMSSTSSGGASVIVLRFNLDVNLGVAEQEVQAAINLASSLLPNDLPTPPLYNKVNPADTPVITLAVTAGSMNLAHLHDLVDTRMVQKIAQVSGVGMVSLAGGQKRALRIKVNTAALAANGFTLADVRRLITSSNVNQPKGNFNGSVRVSMLDANDQLLLPYDYGELILAYKDGRTLKLKDLAEIDYGAENEQMAAWANQQQAVLINVQKQPGANVIKVVQNVQDLLPQLISSMPTGVDIKVINDRTLTIQAAIKDVQLELILAIGLVILVTFLFLRRLSATIIPSVVVPLSLLGTFAVMYLAGFSLNNLTLVALTIATGFVVDDAIVMLENITRYLEEGETPLNAALKGAKQIGFTLISLTFSLIAVLIPLLFMSDVVGRLFREFAITLAVAIIISLLVSLTLTPMMCSKLLKSDSKASNHHLNDWVSKIISYYAKYLKIVLNYQGLTLLVAISTFFLTVILYVVVPKGFFPVQDTGLIQAIIETDQSASFSLMSAKQQEVVNELLQDEDVAHIASYIGIDGDNFTLNTGRLLISLKPHAQRDSKVHEIMQRLNHKVKHLSGVKLYLQPVQDLSIEDKVSRTQYQLSLMAVDEKQLQNWAEKLVTALRQKSELADVNSDLQNKGLQAFLTINRDTASRLGISVMQVVDSLYDAFGQRQISTIFTQSNQYKVVLQAKFDDNLGLSVLKSIYLPAANGARVPLANLVTVSEKNTDLVIQRIGQFPALNLSFNLAAGVSLGQAIKIIEQTQQEINLPLAISSNFQGAALAFKSSLSSTLWLILAAVVVMYIVLGVLYESYIHPITILSTLPSAAVGALLALLLAGKDLGLIAVIGIILLIGIVKKNAIMMIDFALEAERVQGLSAHDAIYQAALLRFRPILMTTLAAVFGAIPLMFAQGSGAELRQPLGITMVGGLLVSQVLTLFTTPVIYLYFDRLAHLKDRFK